MKVFISWSDEVSERFASAFAEWLPNVIQAVDVFFSTEGIRKGAQWFSEISKQLDTTNFGVLCVTPNNPSAPWLLFEAGALAKKVEHARVCPLLLGVSSSQLEGPLAQFNATESTREELQRLVTSINEAMGDKALPASRLVIIGRGGILLAEQSRCFKLVLRGREGTPP